MADVTNKELCKTLRVGTTQVRQWREDGMPFDKAGRSYLYDEQKVVQWLIDNGHFKDKSKGPIPKAVLRTRAEVGRHYKVNTRTVADWMQEAGFPGKPSTKGKRDGFYPIKEIDAWLLGREDSRVQPPGSKSDQQSVHSQRSKLISIKAEKAEIDLKRDKSELFETEWVLGKISEEISNFKQKLIELPGVIDTKLPSETSERDKRIMRNAVKKSVREIFEDMADMHVRILEDDEQVFHDG